MPSAAPRAHVYAFVPDERGDWHADLDADAVTTLLQGAERVADGRLAEFVLPLTPADRAVVEASGVHRRRRHRSAVRLRVRRTSAGQLALELDLHEGRAPLGAFDARALQDALRAYADGEWDFCVGALWFWPYARREGGPRAR